MSEDSKPPSLLLTGLRGASGALFGSSIPALVQLVRRDWFGSGDLTMFAVYTLPFLGCIAGAGILSWHLLRSRSRTLRYSVGLAFGAALGILWTVGNALLLGPWFGAWSIPVPLCWTIGGALGVAAAAGAARNAGPGSLRVEAAVVVVLAAGVSYGLGGVLVGLSQDQHFTLTYARFESSDETLTIHDDRGLLAPREVELLRSASLRGVVTVLGSHASNTATAPSARMLVVLTHRIEKPLRLPQPYRTTVVFLQQNGGFKRLPGDATLLPDRAVEIYPGDPDGNETRYWVDHASGARSGGFAIEW
jgi:hypothetical protein